MGDGADASDEEEPISLEIKHRILLYVYLKGGVPDNISQLTRDMKYRSGKVNTKVHELIDEKCLEEKGGYIKITGKGKRAILPFLFAKYYLSIMLLLISLLLVDWIASELILKMYVTLFDFILALLLITIFSLYLERKYEKYLIYLIVRKQEED